MAESTGVEPVNLSINGIQSRRYRPLSQLSCLKKMEPDLVHLRTRSTTTLCGSLALLAKGPETCLKMVGPEGFEPP